MKQPIIRIAAVTLLAALSACSDKAGSTDSAVPNLADATSPAAVTATREEMALAALPKADRTTPTATYIELSSGNQLMFSYLALSTMPIDYTDIASSYSQEYKHTADEFRKNDLLAALKPKIDAEVAGAGQRRYVKLVIDNPIAKYDFDKKGFPLDEAIWAPGSYRYFSDNSAYRLGFSNGAEYRYLSGVSEASARTIEGLRSKYQPLQLVVYCFTQGADLSNKSIKAEIVKIALLDQKGNILASQ